MQAVIEKKLNKCYKYTKREGGKEREREKKKKKKSADVKGERPCIDTRPLSKAFTRTHS